MRRHIDKKFIDSYFVANSNFESQTDGILATWSSESFRGLGWNIVGLCAITVWTTVLCLFMFYTLKRLDMLRVEAEHEFKGERTFFRFLPAAIAVRSSNGPSCCCCC